MKCKFCSAPLPKKGPICDYCGQRNPLNLRVLSKVDIEEKSEDHNCPVCEIAFDHINIGKSERIVVKRCNDCDGVFITEDILEHLIKREASLRVEVDYRVLRFVQDNPRQKQETVIRYRRCPVCEKMMQRINYRAVSGVIVDRCLRHGVWLDGGELKQLFEWKKAGGSAKKSEVSRNNKSANKGYMYEESRVSSYFDPLGNFFNWLQGG